MEKAVITSLRSKRKLGFIHGSITKPIEKEGKYSEGGKAWEMVNSMVMSWIMNVIDPRLHKSVAYGATTKQLWENIKKRYDAPNIPRIPKLKS